MLATSKNVLFPSHNHPLTNGADDSTLWLLLEHHIFGGGYLVDSGFFCSDSDDEYGIQYTVEVCALQIFVPDARIKRLPFSVSTSLTILSVLNTANFWL